MIQMAVVSIAKVCQDDVEGAVRQAVALSGEFDRLPWDGAEVIIKPNSVLPVKTGTGIVTDVRVVEAVTKLALEKRPKRVVIAEGSSVGYDFKERWNSITCMEKTGVMEVANRLGVEVVDLNQDEQVEVEAADAFVMPRFALAKTALQADILLNVPVIKTHIRTGITCGLKNMKGVLPGDEKKRTHKLGLDKGIVDLNRVIRPTFTIVDGIVGVQGAWSSHVEETDKVALNIVTAGRDVVAVDAVCAAIAGFDPKEILHVQLAAEAKLGTADPSQIDIRGEPIERVSRRFTTFLEASRRLFGAAEIIEKDTCTGCMGECVSTFIYLNKAGFENRLSDLALIMGTPEEAATRKENPVIVGRCAKAHRARGTFVPGCPPHGIKITDAVCEALKIDKGVVHAAIEELHDF
jgi:uncharacterized protein (DUF362 family)